MSLVGIFTVNTVFLNPPNLGLLEYTTRLLPDRQGNAIFAQPHPSPFQERAVAGYPAKMTRQLVYDWDILYSGFKVRRTSIGTAVSFFITGYPMEACQNPDLLNLSMFVVAAKPQLFLPAQCQSISNTPDYATWSQLLWDLCKHIWSNRCEVFHFHPLTAQLVITRECIYTPYSRRIQ